jgi:hypothetical protein
MSEQLPVGADQQLEARIDSAEKNLARLIDWVGKHDNKAAVVLSLATAMLGLLAAAVPAPAGLTPTKITLAAVTVALLGVCLGSLYLGNYPRTAGPPSLLYFNSIAGFSPEEYQRSFAARAREEHLHDLLRQGHAISSILRTKFSTLRSAYRALFLAVLPWLLSIYMFKIQGG